MQLLNREAETVSQLTERIRAALEDGIGLVLVRGEVSELRQSAAGHIYFVIKDQASQIQCVIFKSAARRLRVAPEDGLDSVIHGRLALYAQRSVYQIVVDWLEPVGKGALHQAFLVMRDKLAAEGLFDEATKRPLPLLPRVLGLVTSSTGAALHDILVVLRQRARHLRIVIAHAQVQGVMAPRELTQAIVDLQRLPSPPDLLLLARGGGSYDDLAAFNDESLARTIVACPIPIISAVGHEVDFTIADFAADHRAPTPTAAAELIARRTEESCLQLDRQNTRLISAFHQHVLQRKTHLNLALAGTAFRRPQLILLPLADRLAQAIRLTRQVGEGRVIAARQALLNRRELIRRFSPRSVIAQRKVRAVLQRERLTRAIGYVLDQERQRSAGLSALLNAHNPFAVLKRGYSICTQQHTGQIVRDAASLKPGDRLKIKLARGTADSLVESTSSEG